VITPRALDENFHYDFDFRESYPGLNSVFAAAVVNREFGELLLSDPEVALKQGYLGKGFALSREETSAILSIRAASLSELAQQVMLVLRRQL
jgi:hypothetical protein